MSVRILLLNTRTILQKETFPSVIEINSHDSITVIVKLTLFAFHIGRSYLMSLCVCVCVLHCSPPVAQHMVGPLRMYPAAEDNYGMEACSILCLDTRPQILVVATCEGKLHHCLVLSQPPDTEDFPGVTLWVSSSITYLSV